MQGDGSHSRSCSQKHTVKAQKTVQVVDKQHSRTTCVTVWSPGMTCSPASSFTCCETAASTGSVDITAATHSTHEPTSFVHDHTSEAKVLLDATCGFSSSRSKGKGCEIYHSHSGLSFGCNIQKERQQVSAGSRTEYFDFNSCCAVKWQDYTTGAY